ncbi:MAG: branched-chain amino acid ABC transporter permease [Candidatus Margulisiibacteriota bacterium]
MLKLSYSLAGILGLFGVFGLHLMEQFYMIHILSLMGIYMLLALGLNLVVGFAGLLDLGFIAFYAIGAYTSAILSSHGINFWIGLPFVIGFTCGVRYLVGLPIMKLKGDYLAIVTLGFGEITRLFLNNLDGLTNGPKGLPRAGEALMPLKILSIPLQEEYQFLYLILFFVALGIFIVHRVEKSKFGRALVSIREEAVASEVCGVPVHQIKLFIFTLSAGFSAVAGAIYAHWIGFVSPESFTFWESIFLVCMLILGGIGNIKGILLGTFLLVGLPEWLRTVLGSDLVSYRMLIFGLVLILMVIFRPQGILPEKRHEWELTEKNVRD